MMLNVQNWNQIYPFVWSSDDDDDDFLSSQIPNNKTNYKFAQ